MALSKESQRKLMAALDKTADLLLESKTPNEAIIKAAEEFKVPAGHIHLMVNAVNTGATNAHRAQHETTLDKAASFPIADTEVILKELYPSEVKTKKAEYTKSIVSESYSKAPNWVNTKKASALVIPPLTTQKAPKEVDPDLAFTKAARHIQKLKRDVDEKKLKLAQVRDKAVSLLDELNDYFKSSDSLLLDEVKLNSAILFGKQASIVLDKVTQSNKPTIKRANIRVDINQKPYSLVHAAIKLASEFALVNSSYKQACNLTNKESERLMLPFASCPRQGVSVLGSPLSRMHKTAFLGSLFSGMNTALNLSAAKNMLKNTPGYMSGDTSNAAFNSITDPEHDGDIRNIQSEALLNDLMANDDVVRGYDPEEIVSAFNEVSQLVPHSATKKVIMRDLLRRRLSGGPQALDQFTSGEALKQQGLVRDNEKPEKSVLNLMQDTGALPSGQSNKARE